MQKLFVFPVCVKTGVILLGYRRHQGQISLSTLLGMSVHLRFNAVIHTANHMASAQCWQRAGRRPGGVPVFIFLLWVSLLPEISVLKLAGVEPGKGFCCCSLSATRFSIFFSLRFFFAHHGGKEWFVELPLTSWQIELVHRQCVSPHRTTAYWFLGKKISSPLFNTILWEL